MSREAWKEPEYKIVGREESRQHKRCTPIRREAVQRTSIHRPKAEGDREAGEQARYQGDAQSRRSA